MDHSPFAATMADEARPPARSSSLPFLEVVQVDALDGVGGLERRILFKP